MTIIKVSKGTKPKTNNHENERKIMLREAKQIGEYTVSELKLGLRILEKKLPLNSNIAVNVGNAARKLELLEELKKR